MVFYPLLANGWQQHPSDAATCRRRAWFPFHAYHTGNLPPAHPTACRALPASAHRRTIVRLAAATTAPPDLGGFLPGSPAHRRENSFAFADTAKHACCATRYLNAAMPSQLFSRHCVTAKLSFPPSAGAIRRRRVGGWRGYQRWEQAFDIAGGAGVPFNIERARMVY